jgi:transcriptional regulator with XRE-family HTH domain
MENNCKQKNLCGIEAVTKSICLSDLVHNLTTRHGLETLANELGVDKSALSRFKNGEGALSLDAIEKILTAGGVVLIEEQRYRRLFYALISHSEWLKEASGW